MTKKTIVSILLFGLLAAVGVSAEIPNRPEKISFKPLAFEPPAASDHRHVLKNGVPVYLIEGHEFPLVQINFTFKGGEYLEPDGKAGLAAATGAMMRRGGTTSVSAEEMDEKFDFLATNASTYCGSTTSRASLNSLKSNLDESMALFMDMVRNPGFQADKVQIYKDEVLENMKQRNDSPASIQNINWNAMLYGMDHFEGRIATKATLESITRDDMSAFHGKVFNPANLIVSVTGDFDEKEMLTRLEKALQGWAAGDRSPDPPAPTASPAPGIYYVEKDLPQSRVILGLRSIKRDDPDYFPFVFVDYLLGNGDFTSRITQRVRSDEGLAYTARTGLMPDVYYPGEFRAYTQTKNATVAFALQIMLEEIGRIGVEPVSDQELDAAKNSYIETFPRTFESTASKAGVFVSDEMTGRDANYWKEYRDNVRGVTKEDVLRVAKKYLDTDEMVVLIVGKWEEVEPGDPEGRAKMAEFFGGAVTHLPMLDPLTLEPME